MFPQGVIKVDIKPITLTTGESKKFFIDLVHINKGKEKQSERSKLSTTDVLKFVFLLNELNIEPEMMRGSWPELDRHNNTFSNTRK